MGKDKAAAATKDRKAGKDKKARKDGKAGAGKAKAGANGSGGTLKRLAENPLVADVVAAALVATASALKDSKKAHALAAAAGDEIEKLAKSGARDGAALWGMALEIGRRAVESFAPADAPKPARRKSAAKPGKAGTTGNAGKTGKASKSDGAAKSR